MEAHRRRDWGALGMGWEKQVPSRVLLCFWAKPRGWLCPCSSRNRARGGTGQKIPKKLLLWRWRRTG